MPLIKCFNSLLALKWSGSCIWWCLQAPSKLSIPIQVAGWSLGKCVPELQLWTFNSLVRERETVKVCYFYILCAVGVALSLHDHKVMAILCSLNSLNRKTREHSSSGFAFLTLFWGCVCGLYYHLFHISPHNMQFLQHFEALLSFSAVWQVFFQCLLEYLISAVVKHQYLASLNERTQAHDTKGSADKQICSAETR